MSAFLDPRIVEKPYRKRWVRAAWQLFLRSPVRFGILVAALAGLDTVFLDRVRGVLIPRALMEWLGFLALPLVWTITSAMARGADDRAQTMSAFAGFLRIRVWVSILAAGAFMVAVSWVLYCVFDLLSLKQHVSRSGELLGAIGAQSFYVYCFFGACFPPLLVLMPALSSVEVLRLSRRAAEINDVWQFLALVWWMLALAAVLNLLAPAYGLTGAAWMVFMGILNYVAYRDIFERRPDNLPQEAAAATAAMGSAVSQRAMRSPAALQRVAQPPLADQGTGRSLSF